MANKYKLLNSEEVIRREDEELIKRRKAVHGEDLDQKGLDETRFGIALSGGGIRSATINLGILKTLNKFGILKRADYLSTVSGGGYTGAYVQAMLREKGDYEELFKDKDIDYLRSRGAYMIPGTGFLKTWNTIMLTIGFLISLAMSWLSPALVAALIYMISVFVSKLFRLNILSGFREFISSINESLLNFSVYNPFPQLDVLEIGMYAVLVLFFAHTLTNLILNYHVSISRSFNHVETAIVSTALIVLCVFKLTNLNQPAADGASHNLIDNPGYILVAMLLVLLGFFTNPNALSFHRFYRNQLADAFLHHSGDYKNAKLKDLWDVTKANTLLAPYLLINTCLNLQSTSDPKFKGAKANDYFLLSPLFCGSKLTKYVSTKDTPDYQDITLPAATTVSAAAVNPGMGMYSNKLLSIIMTVFNARLGFWILNPTKLNKSGIVWWPLYFFYELFSKIGTDNRMLNISDGGHIENLGVYELLRRKCRLILAVDAGADPGYGFSDLENLTIRVRNELGLEITFPYGETPEDVIRPKPSHGYSEKRYCIAKVHQLWEEVVPEDEAGKPILDKSGKPIEVLINYKSVRDALTRLTPEENLHLKHVLDVLQISDYIDDVLSTVKSQREIDELYDEYGLEDNVRYVFQTLLQVFQEVKQVLEIRLEHKLDNHAEERRVLRKIIEVIDEKAKKLFVVSTLVYIKSSVVAPQRKLQLSDKSSLEYQTYKYKVYHPSFPHEPTSDQFFDEVQWESYYRVGQYIGADVLGVRNLMRYFKDKKEAPQFNVDQLLWLFDEKIDIFQTVVPVEETATVIFDEPEVLRSRGMNEPEPEEEATASEPAEEMAGEDAAGGGPPSPSATLETEVDDPEFDQIPVSSKIVVGGEDEYSM
ncbi:MAG: hypothetical protein ACI8YQ_000396 [Polaribacter sp.]|jgi:hypothetical protein